MFVQKNKTKQNKKQQQQNECFHTFCKDTSDLVSQNCTLLLAILEIYVLWILKNILEFCQNSQVWEACDWLLIYRLIKYSTAYVPYSSCAKLFLPTFCQF